MKMSCNDVSFSLSAPGKVILMGEHSVLYKKLGLACSINKRTYLHFREHRQAHDQITFNLLGKLTEWDFRSVYNLVTLDKPLLVSGIKDFSIFTPENFRHDDFIDLIQDFVRQKVDETSPIQKPLIGLYFVILGMLWCVDVNITPFDIEVTTELTVGAGTGSSASFAVCIAGAVYHYIRLKAAEKHGSGDYNISYETFKPYKMTVSQHYCGFSKEDKEVINKWAYCVEKIMHGTPSGLDNTVCTFGNAVLINPHPIASDEKVCFNTLDSLPSLKILLINTGIARKTSDLLKKVADSFSMCPKATGAVLNAMDVVAKEFFEIVRGLKEAKEEVMENYRRLELLIDLQQGLLTSLGVSHTRLDEICYITKRRGLHSKLTGAGGGGFAFTLVPPDAAADVVSETIKDLTSAGFQVDNVIVNGEGLALDFK